MSEVQEAPYTPTARRAAIPKQSELIPYEYLVSIKPYFCRHCETKSHNIEIFKVFIHPNHHKFRQLIPVESIGSDLPIGKTRKVQVEIPICANCVDARIESNPKHKVYSTEASWRVAMEEASRRERARALIESKRSAVTSRSEKTSVLSSIPDFD